MKIKNLVFSALISSIFSLIACHHEIPVQIFGEAVDSTQAIKSADLKQKMQGLSTINVTISGKVVDVCKAEGCWMKLDLGDEKQLLIRMKNHSFSVDDVVKGKYAFVKGTVRYDTVSVESLKKHAKENGESDSIVSALTVPQINLVMEATGVMTR